MMNKTNMFILKFSAVCLLMLYLASTASAAYSLHTWYWNSDHVSYKINASFPSSYRASVTKAANNWSNAGSAFDYYASTTNVVSYYNLGVGGPTGRTQPYVYTGTNFLSRIDIVINSAYTWSTSEPCPSTSYDIESTLAHEFGHGAGVNHSTYNTSTMWYGASKGSTHKRSLEQDDKNAIIKRYGT